jgi:hypothetical protein
VEEDDGPKRRTSPVHAEQAGMCEESDVPTRIHARPAAAEAWKRLQGYVGGTNAALPDATQPIAAMHAGPPGPTFARRTPQSERLPIDTGKEPFARTGGTSEPSHSELCICANCWVLPSMFAAMYLYLSTSFHLLLCLCCPSQLFALIASPYLACQPSFLKRWQHSVIASR